MIGAIVAEGTTPADTVAIVLIVAAKFAPAGPHRGRSRSAAGRTSSSTASTATGSSRWACRTTSSQPVDKITDWVTYVAIVVVAFRNDWPTKRLMLGLFLFRSIGQVGFLLTGNELLSPSSRTSSSRSSSSPSRSPRLRARDPPLPRLAGTRLRHLYRYRWLIGTLIVIYKLQDEWITHVGNIDRTEFLEQLFGG